MPKKCILEKDRPEEDINPRQGPPTGGTTYIRWGRTTCPSENGTELLYSGRAGGTDRRHKGGAANYLCMPDDPYHLQYQTGVQGHSFVAGVEYDYSYVSSLYPPVDIEFCKD